MAYNNYGKNNHNFGGSQRGTYPGDQNRGGQKEGTGYIGSPYNFVPFAEKVCEYTEDKPAHNRVSEELFSGEIPYTITAKTKIMIDDGTGHFYQDNYGRAAIPGSSVRGLIRSNVQVLSMSSVDQDVDDYALMYRTIAGKDRSMKDTYSTKLGAKTISLDNGTKKQSISILENVRAGYIACEGGEYFIYDTELDQVQKEFKMMNYFILSERKIAEEYSKRGRTGKFSYEFFIKPKNILQHDYQRPFKESVDRNNRKHYTADKNNGYAPYELPCSYERNGRHITAVGKPGQYAYEGYAVSTGKMNEKKAIYIIPAISKEKATRFDGNPMPICIPEKDIQAFKIDLKRRKTTLKSFGGEEHFDLPEEGRIRPVFYIYMDGRLYFGFTPRLRLFFNHTIKEGLGSTHTESELDYTKALFGYSNQQDSYKSRVSFSDAIVNTGSVKDGELEYAILGEPKPTSYFDYVSPYGNTAQNYNADNFHLRGMKQYWLRQKAESNVPDEKKKEKYVSQFYPLPAGISFQGKVRFHNLKKEEIGLLLWALKLDGDSWMNIGKAKAFGFGNISLNVEGLKLLDTKSAYQLDSLCLNPWVEADVDEYIDVYKQVMSARIGTNIEDTVPVKALLAMKNPALMPKISEIRFMELGEYQSRTTPLQNIGELTGNPSLASEISLYGMTAKEKKDLKWQAKSNSAGSKFQGAKRAYEISTSQEALSEPVPTPKPVVQKTPNQFVVGKEYNGTVKKVEGKNVKFVLENNEYPTLKIGENGLENYSKKDAKQKLEGKAVVLRYDGKDEDTQKNRWTFVRLQS